jgi:choline dehydrogenase
MCLLIYPAPGIGVPMSEVALSMGPDALRAPAGPLPSDPADDVKLPPDLQALKQEAERRLAEWRASGRGLGASSLADAVVFCSSGFGDAARHDIEIELLVTAGNEEFLRTILNLETARFFEDAGRRVANDAENLTLLPHLALPHSRGKSFSNAPIPPLRRQSA